MAYDRGGKPVQCKRVDCGVNETSDWRVFSTGPIRKVVWMGMITRLCNIAKGICGKSSAPLQSVIKRVMILPVLGMELRPQRGKELDTSSNNS
jgi:hypothetical protein